MWLNQNSGNDLITCVQLTPYRDAESNSFYIQASGILPVPGTEKFLVGVGPSGSRAASRKGLNDEVTGFLRGAAAAAVDGLPEELRPSKKSRWAGVGRHVRYYGIWYPIPPWHHELMSYQLLLLEKSQGPPHEAIAWFSVLGGGKSGSPKIPKSGFPIGI